MATAMALGLALLAIGFIAGLLFAFLRPKKSFPFKGLAPRGVYKSAALPCDGDSHEERKRDFARIVSPSATNGLFVVSAASGCPVPWKSSGKHDTGDVSKEVADAVFGEFSEWIARQMQGTRREGLAQRVVACVAASEGFTFAMQHQIPPMFPQSQFVLVLTNAGEVRVVWLAFATDKVEANLSSTPYILKLVTRDLNSEQAASEASSKGIEMDYVMVHAKDKQLSDYVQKRHVAAFSRAAVENTWDDVFGSV